MLLSGKSTGIPRPEVAGDDGVKKKTPSGTCLVQKSRNTKLENGGVAASDARGCAVQLRLRIWASNNHHGTKVSRESPRGPSPEGHLGESLSKGRQVKTGVEHAKSLLNLLSFKRQSYWAGRGHPRLTDILNEKQTCRPTLPRIVALTSRILVFLSLVELYLRN